MNLSDLHPIAQVAAILGPCLVAAVFFWSVR